MYERWITKTELCEHFRITDRTLAKRFYPLATKGTHYITKNPLNDNGHRDGI